MAPDLAPYTTQQEEEVPSVPGEGGTVLAQVRRRIRRSDGEDPTSRAHAVVLKEIDGDRRLPVYIGAPEAVAQSSARSSSGIKSATRLSSKLSASSMDDTASIQKAFGVDRQARWRLFLAHPSLLR
jgi:hypothetical protein